MRPGPGQPLELYDLKADPTEKNDLAAKQPEVLAKAESLMKAARTDRPEWSTRLGTGKAKAKAGKAKAKKVAPR